MIFEEPSSPNVVSSRYRAAYNKQLVRKAVKCSWFSPDEERAVLPIDYVKVVLEETTASLNGTALV